MAEKLLNKKIKSGEAGQTLIELVIAIGLAVVLVGALLNLSSSSNQRAALTRQANQATRLTQEGMELVRNIRNVNAVAVRPFGWISFSELYNSDLVGDIPFYLRPPGPNPACIASESWCLNAAVGSEDILVDNLTFSRTIFIADDTIPPISECNSISGATFTESKQVRVLVEWDSPIGPQERTVVSCFTRQ